MKPVVLSSIVLGIVLAGCQSGNADTEAGPGGAQTTKGALAGWQTSLLGQEGHGGNAVVCFSIPVERALYQASTGEGDNCVAGEPCLVHGGPNTTPGAVWRMTDEGRRSIISAQPLEEYLGSRTASGKRALDQFNQMSVEDGYRQAVLPFAKLPAASSHLQEMHRKLGWLTQDGVSSEYGLLDVNDSGFLNENEIDRAYCKELQAVVRRDNQLWYDSDIIHHFDAAGLVAIQLHEEIYAWGKNEDEINREIAGPPAHMTSANTRRLILKIFGENLASQLLNENLKTLGFSAGYWETSFNVPTPVGYFMDTDACVAEQGELKDLMSTGGYGNDFWLAVEEKFSSRYLKGENGQPLLPVRFNFPRALANMIGFTMNYHGPREDFRNSLIQLLQKFELPGTCGR
jgi:hypothetical protein